MNDAVRELFKKDLSGELDGFEYPELASDVHLWRDELVAELQSLDKQFTSRRASSLECGTHDARVAYEKWRKSACGYKAIVVSRLQDINAHIREQNIINYPPKEMQLNKQMDILENILGRLTSIETMMKDAQIRELHNPYAPPTA